MKQIILTFMAAVMMATSSFAMSPAIDSIDGGKDFTNLESLVIDLAPEAAVVEADAISDWDYFWGTTLNPANTGWNDFWFQCQDPDKTTGDCVGTVFAGIGAVGAGALAAYAAIVGVTFVAVAAVTTTPMTAGTVWAAASPIGITSSGAWIF